MSFFWKYLSKGEGGSGENVGEDPEVKIDYAQVQMFFEKIKKVEGINLFAFPTSKMANTFQDVIGTLNGLLNVIFDLREKEERSKAKLEDYDHMKKLLSRHTEMIKQMEEQKEVSLKKLLQERTQMKQKYEKQIKKLENQVQSLKEQLRQTKKNAEELKRQFQNLSQRSLDNQQKIQQMAKAKQKVDEKIKSMLDLKLKKGNEKIRKIEKIDIVVILYYEKLRKNIYHFLQPKDYEAFSCLNKQIHYISNETLKSEYFPILLSNKNKDNQKMISKINEYKKIYDMFPTENIRMNALKFLFFKFKPGSYLLPYFQEQSVEQETEKQKEKEKGKEKGKERSRWSQISLWKRKQESQNIEKEKSKANSLAVLKNQAEFREVQKKIQIFFENLFEIDLPSDLRSFSFLMEKQYEELKDTLKNFQRPQQILCLSKFLYLQTTELHNLLQVCFSLLLNSTHEVKENNRKFNDVIENDKVLRNLVDSLAKDRGVVQKRMWELENENISLKNQIQKVNLQAQKVLIEKESLEESLSICSKENKHLKGHYDKDSRERKKLEEKMQQIILILGEVPHE